MESPDIQRLNAHRGHEPIRACGAPHPALSSPGEERETWMCQVMMSGLGIELRRDSLRQRRPARDRTHTLTLAPATATLAPQLRGQGSGEAERFMGRFQARKIGRALGP